MQLETRRNLSDPVRSGGVLMAVFVIYLLKVLMMRDSVYRVSSSKSLVT